MTIPKVRATIDEIKGVVDSFRYPFNTIGEKEGDSDPVFHLNDQTKKHVIAAGIVNKHDAVQLAQIINELGRQLLEANGNVGKLSSEMLLLQSVLEERVEQLQVLSIDYNKLEQRLKDAQAKEAEAAKQKETPASDETGPGLEVAAVAQGGETTATGHEEKFRDDNDFSDHPNVYFEIAGYSNDATEEQKNSIMLGAKCRHQPGLPFVTYWVRGLEQPREDGQDVKYRECSICHPQNVATDNRKTAG